MGFIIKYNILSMHGAMEIADVVWQISGVVLVSVAGLPVFRSLWFVVVTILQVSVFCH